MFPQFKLHSHYLAESYKAVDNTTGMTKVTSFTIE